MKRWAPFFVILCSATLAVRGLYAFGIVNYSASDGAGHGPDHGTVEWESGRQSSIWTRSVIVGFAIAVPVGIICAWRKKQNEK